MKVSTDLPYLTDFAYFARMFTILPNLSAYLPQLSSILPKCRTERESCTNVHDHIERCTYCHIPIIYYFHAGDKYCRFQFNAVNELITSKEFKASLRYGRINFIGF